MGMRSCAGLALLVALCIAGWATPARADETTAAAVGRKVDAVAADAAAVAKRVEENRLTNQTRDQVVAWAVIGLLVGGVAGTLLTLNTKGFGGLGNVALGLIGSYIGGLIVRVTRIDLGWGETVIRYDQAMIALICALVMVLGYRFLSWRRRARAKARLEKQAEAMK